MKKNVCLIFCIVMLSFFIGISNTEARKVCRYANTTDANISATFSITTTGDVGDATIDGTIRSTDEKTIDSNEEGVTNWEDSYDDEYSRNPLWTGKKHYEENNSCPNKAVFFDTDGWFAGEFKFYVVPNSEYANMIYEDIGSEHVDGWAIMNLIEDAEVPEPVQKKCFEYTTSDKCEQNTGYSVTRSHACVWNSEYEFCNVNDLTYLKCGSSSDIPEIIPFLISYAVTILKIVTPIVLIVVSIMTLVKAVAAQKDDEIKKAQSKLIKKVIAAVMIFFVISIVQFIVLKVADGKSEVDDIKQCLNCMLNNDCDGNTYFKDGYGKCYSVKNTSNNWKCDI